MGWDGQWSPPPTTIPSGEAGARGRKPRRLVRAGRRRSVPHQLPRVPQGGRHGAPPEINSLIGPVQAASAAVDDRTNEGARETRRRGIHPPAHHEHRGRPAQAPQDRRTQHAVVRPSVRRRDHARCGPISTSWPACPTRSRGALTVTEPADRVGELVVKGTCHICHDATRADNAPTTVLSGVIPALASMPRTKTSPSSCTRCARARRCRSTRPACRRAAGCRCSTIFPRPRSRRPIRI